MSTAIMDPATAVTWGSFIRAAEAQYASNPGQVNPAAITNMPAGYTLVRTIQMTDFFGPVRSRVFYGYVAVGGDPPTAVVALRGTATTLEWWDDLQWNLVPFTQVSDGGNVAQGFYDIYTTFGTMTPGQQARRHGRLLRQRWVTPPSRHATAVSAPCRGGSITSSMSSRTSRSMSSIGTGP